MVEVLIRRTPPAEKVFDVACLHCRSELRFTRSEATYHPDQRDGDYLQIACPVCGHSVTKGLP